MALVQTSSIISDISGKLGGGVFARSSGGLTLRTKSTPIKSNTSKQQSTKLQLSVVATGWTGLTAAQQAQWQSFSTYSQSFTGRSKGQVIDGRQWYIKANWYRTLAGLTTQAVPVFNTPSSFISNFKAIVAGGVMTIDSNPTNGGASNKYYIRISRPTTTVVRKVPTGLTNVVAASYAGSVATVTASYLASFGILPTVGQWVYLDIVEVYSAFTQFSDRFKGWVQVTAS